MSRFRALTGPQLQRLILQYRRQLELANGRGGAELSALGSRLEARIVAEIAKQTGDVALRDVTDLTKFVKDTLRRNDEEFREIVTGEVRNVYGIALDRVADVAEQTLDPGGLRRAMRAFGNYESGIAGRRILKTADRYVDLWAGEWNAQWESTARNLQSTFTRAAATGQSWRDVASAVSDDLASLKIAGRMSPEQFARAFVRTKYNELYNEAGMEIGREAGLELFVSIGVPDERQSEICYEASQQPAMTLEEWESSQWGVPPRHVMNCRCTLVAVPEDTTTKPKNTYLDEKRKEREKEEVAV